MMKYEVTILQSSSDATQGRIAITSAFQEKTGENCMGRYTFPDRDPGEVYATFFTKHVVFDDYYFQFISSFPPCMYK